MKFTVRVRFVLAAVSALGVADAASGQAPPSYDFHFTTVGAVGNAAFNNPSWPFATVSNGRGSVNYEYRMSKLEVTTSQWMEFINTYSTQGLQGRIWEVGPSHWGAQVDPLYTGPGVRWKLKNAPNAAMYPVTAITWRDAAMFCNWLTNDKSSALSAYQNGAYDISTFTTNTNGTFNDQRTHSPGAKFWIPTFDEMLKAQHYDPDRYGAGQPGWWMYPNSSDVKPFGGPPGQGQANTEFELPQFGQWGIPLGSYPAEVSPWGLLDGAGSTAEWTEYIYFKNLPEERGLKGSSAGGSPSSKPGLDHANNLSSGKPYIVVSRYGLRIASAVPSPGGVTLLLVGSSVMFRRTRRGGRSPCCHL